MKYMSFRILALFMLGVSGLAQGAIISSTMEDYGSTNASVTLDANQFIFDWQGTPVTLSVLFTSNSQFSLSLDSFLSSGNASDVTGFTLDIIDGTSFTRLTNDTTFCHSAQTAISGTNGGCNLISLSGATGSNANVAYEPGEMLFSWLDAGTYRLGIYDSSSPVQGTAAIGYSQVPAPASALLFVMGFGALALRRRSKK
ncbi:PEP-CTERM sorting domain-containing protein [Alteromonas halophila]|uniref:PEP-CTERM sorting domain-containing protein n=1 Tax=Alteromonas halophila TaxID=516698 RepID=A0A918JNL9_9ALTE|nr:PEP-CTERM sorting domain-containing protein [Alteromonas halophila]GGW89254.1 hypothetical protein GCM10007391_24340 [Alteromonas halophila]